MNGFPIRNPDTLVERDASIKFAKPPRALRGEAKLVYALDRVAPAVRGRVAMDVGAAAGGFTKTLLAAGARRVYAVDAGHGQLVGELRQDKRVVHLEADQPRGAGHTSRT